MCLSQFLPIQQRFHIILKAHCLFQVCQATFDRDISAPDWWHELLTAGPVSMFTCELSYKWRVISRAHHVSNVTCHVARGDPSGCSGHFSVSLSHAPLLTMSTLCPLLLWEYYPPSHRKLYHTDCWCISVSYHCNLTCASSFLLKTWEMSWHDPKHAWFLLQSRSYQYLATPIFFLHYTAHYYNCSTMKLPSVNHLTITLLNSFCFRLYDSANSSLATVSRCRWCLTIHFCPLCFTNSSWPEVWAPVISPVFPADQSLTPHPAHLPAVRITCHLHHHSPDIWMMTVL